MNKSGILTILKADRAKFDKLLAEVGTDRLDLAGVSGFYSTKDILAHLEAYDPRSSYGLRKQGGSGICR